MAGYWRCEECNALMRTESDDPIPCMRCGGYRTFFEGHAMPQDYRPMPPRQTTFG